MYNTVIQDRQYRRSAGQSRSSRWSSSVGMGGGKQC